MGAWATQECRCGHPRFRHGAPRFAGACDACLCDAFAMPPPAPDLQGPPPPPEPDRTPHPNCPRQDPDCDGVHHDLY